MSGSVGNENGSRWQNGAREESLRLHVYGQPYSNLRVAVIATTLTFPSIDVNHRARPRRILKWKGFAGL
jgi:hypothetical protein